MKKTVVSSLVVAAILAGCGDSSCCNVDSSLGVTSNNIPPVAVITGLTNGTVVPAGGSVSPSASTSTDRDGTVTGYSWTVGGVATSTEINPTITFATAGTYDVCLTVTDNNNLKSANVECRTVTAQAADTTTSAPVAVITVDAIPPLHVSELHTFSCVNSYDTDKVGPNPEIVRCDWKIQSYRVIDGQEVPYRNCSLDNNTTNTVWLCPTVHRIVTTLTVTDNDGQVNSTTKEYTNFIR